MTQSSKQQGIEVAHKVTWSIGRKLTLSFLGLVSLIVVVGIVALVGLYVLNDNVNQLIEASYANEEADHTEINVNLFLAFEEQYLADYGPLGLQEARTQYVTPAQQAVSDMRTSLTAIATLESSHAEHSAHINETVTLVGQMETTFLAQVTKVEERGFEDTGLEGKLRDAVHNVEDALAAQTGVETLEITMLQMRRHEKDYMLRGDQTYVTDVHNTAAQLKTQIAASSLSSSDKRNLTGLVDTYVTNFDALVKVDGEIAMLKVQLDDQSDKVVAAVDEIRIEIEGDKAAAIANLANVTNGVVALLLGGILLAVALGLGVAVVMSRNISNPIRRLTDVARAVAGGDLTMEADVRSGDESGMLAGVFNTMIARLREMLSTEQQQREYLERTVEEYVAYAAKVGEGNLTVQLDLAQIGRGATDEPLLVLGHQLNATTTALRGMLLQIREAVNNLNSAAAEIQAAVTQQTSGASEQSAAITQTTTTVDEVKTLADQSVARAQEVATAAQRTVEISRSGQTAIRNTVDSMGLIKNRVEGIAENTLALSEQTQQIGEIIDTVNTIASQSNMLALNASVEAARAGEHGKGFAAVAQEVRALADQSRQATSQVKTILSDIQQATNSTVMATEEGTKGVDAGLQLIAQMEEVIQQLASAITESAQVAAQVVAGGQQQASGVEQIAVAMTSINQATMQSLASTRQVEKAAQDLSELARNLTATVSQYQM